MENTKQMVLDYVREKDWVSYVEIERIFEQNGFDYKGELDIASKVCDRVILWGGWNRQAGEILNALQRENLIYKEPATIIPYFIEGKMLELPLVKSFRRYKTPHWLPTLFRPCNVKK